VVVRNFKFPSRWKRAGLQNQLQQPADKSHSADDQLKFDCDMVGRDMSSQDLRLSKTAAALAGQVMGSGEDAFVVAEWRDAGGQTGQARPIAPLHLHHEDDEAWYVLEGTLGVQVGKEVVEAKAGAGVFVPRGTPHKYWNAGPGPMRYLLIMTGRIYRLIQAIHAMPDRNMAALREVFAKHNSELIES
jgi:mannose-6-phosphate isomerase-like protein (cupin superfamily)